MKKKKSNKSIKKKKQKVMPVKKCISFNDEQVDEFRIGFDLFDSNKSGSITFQELKKGLDSLGQKITNEELEAILEEVDEEKDGEIDFPEFIEVLKKSMIKTDPEVILKECFDVFDDESIGLISIRDLSHSLKRKLPEDDVQEIISLAKELNGNRDSLNFDQFKKLMSKQ